MSISANYRQLLEAECEMLMSMGEGEREAWIDNNCRSSFLSSGRMPEGTWPDQLDGGWASGNNS